MPLARSLWLATNGRTASIVRDQLLDRTFSACFAPGVLWFDGLPDVILGSVTALRRPTRPNEGLFSTTEKFARLTPAAERDLLRRTLAHVAARHELTFFAESAERSQFTVLLAEHIRELKRRGITPDCYSKAAPPQADRQRHRELALLYAEYDKQLRAHGLCDSEDAPWAAIDALASGACRRFEELDMVVVDGFTDFTSAQLAMLRLLAERASHLLISLPLENISNDSVASRADASGVRAQRTAALRRNGARAELFAKCGATLAELRGLFPQLEERWLAPRSTGWPALDHLTGRVFADPTSMPPLPAEAVPSLAKIEVVEAAGAHDEIVQIARRIKQRLTAGTPPVRKVPGDVSGTGARSEPLLPVRPSDIAVVFRSLSDVGPRIREVFDQFGIPYSLAARQPLIARPIIKTLLALLRLEEEDWPFRRVLALITNHLLTAIDSDARRAADWLVRDLQIASGREELLERVDALAADDAAARRGEHAGRRSSRAKAALAALRTIAGVLDALPQEATPGEWSARLGKTLGELNPAGWDEEDLAAWQSLVLQFAQLGQVDAWLGEPTRKLGRNELLTAIIDVASHSTLPAAHDDVGRVRVLDAPAARTIRVKHLFLAGLSEQAFPSPERAGRLGSDSEYRFYSRVASQSSRAAEVAPATRAQEEMLLFYEVLSRAEESLTISFPALDDKAQNLPSSPYVTELERVLGQEGWSKIHRTAPQLSPVPDTNRCTEPGQNGKASGSYSLADWRIHAIAQALAGQPQPLGCVFASAEARPFSSALDAGVRIIHARARHEFGSAEGLLNSPAAAKRLAQRFGPQHAWSPSRWETYATCPYRFFVESVLGLEPLGDLLLETDFARRGSRLHDVLAAFHREWPQLRDGRPLSKEEEETAFLEYLHQVVESRMSSSSRGGIEAALLELDRRQVRKWVQSHYQHHSKYGALCSELGGQLAPKYFEFRFGPPRAGEESQDGVSEPFEINIDGEPIRIIGQIDRIDVGEINGRRVFNVIDYKSGRKVSFKPEHLDSGEKLQLPIYVEAAQALLFDGEAKPLVAGYWSMAAGFDGKGALSVVTEDVEKRWAEVRSTTRRLIRQFVDGIRNGEFPVFSRDEKCTSYCDFSTICRVSQARSLRKVWPSSAACGSKREGAPPSGESVARG